MSTRLFHFHAMSQRGAATTHADGTFTVTSAGPLAVNFYPQAREHISRTYPDLGSNFAICSLTCLGECEPDAPAGGASHG